jgi:hypothetical protein
VIDLEPYPEHTDQVLEALRWFHDENNTEATTFRRIASECPDLNKDQVMYRVFDHLLEDNYLNLNWVNEHNQDVAYVGACKETLETARAREKTIELLGEVPEEPTKDDILKLINHIRSLQTGIDSDDLPDFVQNQEQNAELIQNLEAKVADLNKKIGDIEDHDETIRSNSSQVQNLEERMNKIETKMGFNDDYGDEIGFSDYLKMKSLIKAHDKDLKQLGKKADAGYFYVLDDDATSNANRL